ncbi:MAG: hypothetical protein IJH87_00015 [Atopobiaceae bacterium]|nr:hypothetical protein [Atopobiaceae bacterium]
MDGSQEHGIRLHVDRSEVLRYLGYAGQTVDASLDERIDSLISRCEEVSEPSWTFRVFPIEHAEEGIRLTGTSLVLAGESIRTHLAESRFCAVMAATAGLSNERELRRLSLLNGLDGMVFDAAGSALAETAADACNASIIEYAHARGLFSTWRFSPGYGDLPLSLQPAIARVLELEKRLGISVTDSLMLIPAKSVTAFVGLSDTPQETERSCATCGFFPYCNIRKGGSACTR